MDFPKHTFDRYELVMEKCQHSETECFSFSNFSFLVSVFLKENLLTAL